MLVIRRVDAGWLDSQRQYRVLIDDVQRALLNVDDAVQLPVTPGPHRVRLSVGWCGSKEIHFDIRHGEIVRMQCRQNAALWSVLLYVTIWRNGYIFLETVTT